MSKIKGVLFVISVGLVLSTFLAVSSVSGASMNTVVKRMLFDNGYSASVIAADADMYMCHYNSGSKVLSIHKINPNVICLLYRNMRSVSSYSSEYQTFVSNKWILKDAKGNAIRDASITSNYLVDQGNPAYQQWVANWVKGYINQYGYNGVFADCSLYTTIHEDCYGTNWLAGSTGPPINPRTGQAYTDQQMEAAEISLINEVKSVIGSKLYIANGVFTGQSFFQRSYSDILLQSKIDGVESEGWMLNLYSYNWYTEAQWVAAVNFTVWLGNNFFTQQAGRMFLPVCQNAQPYDASHPVLPSGCSQQQYALFCYGSLLLGASTVGGNYLNLAYYLPTAYGQSLFKIDIGTPTNKYYMIAGTHVYARDFSQGKVLVNPTSTSYSVNFNGNYQTTSGQKVTMPLTIAPHTATILQSLAN